MLESRVLISAHAFAAVDDALHLADRARQVPGHLDVDGAGDAEALLDAGGHELVEAVELDGADARLVGFRSPRG